jgi:CRISPR type III-B/RAMP module-associated protein Cmr5
MDTVRQVFGNKGNIPEGFRSRARDIPSSLYYGGVLYTLAYVASKASKDKASGDDLLMQAFLRDDVGALFKEWFEKKLVEDEAYELYGVCLMRALRELVGISKANSLTDILRMLNDPGMRVIAERRLLEFTEWLKRLAEAVVQKG